MVISVDEDKLIVNLILNECLWSLIYPFIKRSCENMAANLSTAFKYHYSGVTVNVQKFGTLVTCQKDLEKQCRTRSDYF